MLQSVKIAKRQSEIRQKLAELSGKDSPDESETNEMRSLDTEYQGNEVRYRASLIAEDSERQEAGKDLETRDGKEFATLVDKFELRQVAALFDHGHELEGATKEVVQEMRSKGTYQGCPVPWEALETRTGETVSTGTPDPIKTMPIIDRLFPDSVAAKMGASMVDVGTGSIEYPVSLGAAVVGWQATELGDVGALNPFATVERTMKPDFTLGTQMEISRRALKQSGPGLEAAVRREMNAAIGAEMDRIVFQGSGASGEPKGILEYADDSPIPFYVKGVDGKATWGTFREAVVEFMLANAANSPAAVKALLRPEIWDAMDEELIGDTAMTEWDRLLKHIPAGNIVLSANALPAPDNSPLDTVAVLTTAVGGVPPIVVGRWGGVDLIRDPYKKAASGGLVLTALATMDVSYLRGEQVGVLTGVQV